MATPSPPPINKTAIKLTTQDDDDITVVTEDSTVDSPMSSSARASRQAILKSANQAVKDNHLWCFDRDGKFLVALCNKNWSALPGRVLSTSTSYRYYHSKKEGDNRSSIHDMCQRAFPGIFDLSSATSSNWRQALVSKIITFAHDLFQSPSPDLLGITEIICAPNCMASLALTRPDKFEHFYSNGNLDFSIEGGFWLAANTVLGSRWQMKMPTSISSTVDIFKGPRCVAFHHAPGTTVQSGRS